jgi:hypothetical protein
MLSSEKRPLAGKDVLSASVSKRNGLRLELLKDAQAKASWKEDEIMKILLFGATGMVSELVLTQRSSWQVAVGPAEGGSTAPEQAKSRVPVGLSADRKLLSRWKEACRPSAILMIAEERFIRWQVG